MKNFHIISTINVQAKALNELYQIMIQHNGDEQREMMWDLWNNADIVDIEAETSKNYYIRAEVSEEYPDYDFIIKAQTQAQAEKQAKKILMHDYPDIFVGKYADRFSCHGITAQELLEILTIK